MSWNKKAPEGNPKAKRVDAEEVALALLHRKGFRATGIRMTQVFKHPETGDIMLLQLQGRTQYSADKEWDPGWWLSKPIKIPDHCTYNEYIGAFPFNVDLENEGAVRVDFRGLEE